MTDYKGRILQFPSFPGAEPDGPVSFQIQTSATWLITNTLFDGTIESHTITLGHTITFSGTRLEGAVSGALQIQQQIDGNTASLNPIDVVDGIGSNVNNYTYGGISEHAYSGAEEYRTRVGAVYGESYTLSNVIGAPVFTFTASDLQTPLIVTATGVAEDGDTCTTTYTTYDKILSSTETSGSNHYSLYKEITAIQDKLYTFTTPTHTRQLLHSLEIT